VNFTEQEARRIHQAYHRKYRGISRYHRFCWDNYKTHVFETAFGHRNLCRLGTDASNYATQGSIAEATKWSIHALVSKHPKALKYIINVVHDAIYLDVPKKKAKKWEKWLQTAMLEGWKEVCKSDLFHFKDIPMPVDIEYIGKELGYVENS